MFKAASTGLSNPKARRIRPSAPSDQRIRVRAAGGAERFWGAENTRPL